MFQIGLKKEKKLKFEKKKIFKQFPQHFFRETEQGSYHLVSKIKKFREIIQPYFQVWYFSNHHPKMLCTYS